VFFVVCGGLLLLGFVVVYFCLWSLGHLALSPLVSQFVVN